MEFQIPKHLFHASEYRGCDAFLAACGSLPLEKVRADLERYQGLLDSQLVALVNKDYAEFVELSASILGTDAMIRSVRGSLEKARDEVRGVAGAVEGRAKVLRDRQALLRAAEEERRALVGLVTLHESLEEVEGLLGPGGGCEGRLGMERGELVERAAVQFGELSFEARKRAGSKLVQSLRPRIARLESQIEGALKELFLEALTPASLGTSGEELARCLRVYGMLGRGDAPRELFRRVVVGPLVAEIVGVRQLEAGNRTSCDGLAAIFDRLIGVALTGVAAAVRSEGDGAAGLVQAAFDEMIEQLTGRLGSQIFATGIPETFHRNWTLSREFVQRWEREVLAEATPGVVRAFRSSESLKKWNRGWKVDVYFTLRAQEVIRTSDQILLSSQPLRIASSSSSLFVVGGIDSVVEQMRRVWADDVFLPGLEASFLRLSFQIVARLKFWILAGLPESVSSSSSSLESPWSGASPSLWAAARCDLSRLAHEMRSGVWAEAAKKKLGNSAPVEAATELAAKEVEVAAEEVGRHVTSRVAGECAAALQFARKISSLFFRADAVASGGLPETPMPEVEQVLAPLRRLLQAAPFLEREEKKKLCDEVGATVLRSYRDLAQEVLVQAAATQKFIAQRSGASGNGMAKIGAQFRLDADRLGQLLAEEGVVLPELMEAILQTIAATQK